MAENKEEFGNYLGQMANLGFVANGVGLGSELGLFDIMVNHGKPMTSQEIATAGNFKERYVREWLALMVTGRVIDYDATNGKYFIAEDKIPFLSKSDVDKHGSSIIMMEAIPILSSASNEVKKCFPNDGQTGISYKVYTDFHKWKVGHTARMYSYPVMKQIFDMIPGIVQKLESGTLVCEIGCSEGYQLRTLATHFPKSTFLGVDISEGAIANAKAEAAKEGLKNLSYIIQDGCNMPEDWSSKYDYVYVNDVVHDVPYSLKFLKEIYRVLKPGGFFHMIDVKTCSDLEGNRKVPYAPMTYGFSLFHCMPVSLFFEGGEGLGTCWGTEMQREYLDRAGFVDIQLLDSGDPTQNHYIGTKQN